MSSIRNPYNNVENYKELAAEPQPYGSVVDKIVNNENVLIETAGLNQYNFLDVGQELNAWNDVQKIQRAAFPPNRTKEFNVDTTNQYYPHIMPLYYQGAASNSRLLNNPPDHNQNLDMASQRTYIKPFYTVKEQFGTQLPIEAEKTLLSLGPVYITKTIISPN